MFMKWGEQEPQKHDLSSLRLLGSVGESINPEAWMWYYEHIGGSRCPIVDTWWQTETGGQMISPLPGVTTLKPGSACFALPGIGVEVVDEEGHPIERGGGYLTLTRPWPSMLRGIWGDPERYKDTYWSRYPGRYFAGDGAKIDAAVGGPALAGLDHRVGDGVDIEQEGAAGVVIARNREGDAIRRNVRIENRV
jgi:acetyl-CoA synthetase